MASIECSSITVPRRGQESFPGGDADRTVIWLRGEHDASTAVALSDTLARAITLDDADVVVDLSGVEFMDAATVGVLVGSRNFLRPRSRSLILRSPSEQALFILELCGLSALAGPPTAQDGALGAPALGTWVEVPATDRRDLPPDGSPEPSRTQGSAGQRATNQAR